MRRISGFDDSTSLSTVIAANFGGSELAMPSPKRTVSVQPPGAAAGSLEAGDEAGAFPAEAVEFERAPVQLFGILRGRPLWTPQQCPAAAQSVRGDAAALTRRAARK